MSINRLQVLPDSVRESGLCRNVVTVDPTWWTTYATERGGRAKIRKAIIVCNACPALDDCRAFALRTNQEHFVWGGLTDSERREIRRARRSADIVPT